MRGLIAFSLAPEPGAPEPGASEPAAPPLDLQGGNMRSVWSVDTATPRRRFSVRTGIHLFIYFIFSCFQCFPVFLVYVLVFFVL